MVEEKIINGWVSSPNGRGTLDILWSSLFTIFLSTWTALYLNVPAPDDGFLEIMKRKFKWMLFTALMPEMTIMFALAQWIRARKTAKFLKQELGCPDWTLSQAFYVEMGGLSMETMIRDNPPRHDPRLQHIRRRLYPEYNAGQNCEASEMEIKTITEDERRKPELRRRNASERWENLPLGTIQLKWLLDKGHLQRRDHEGKLRGYDLVEVIKGKDRVTVPCLPDLNHFKIREVSRSDLVLKIIWLIQVSWYLLQCIARATQHLSISLLELSTVGLVICAVIIQTLWWSKPLDVQCATTIPIKDLSLEDEKEAKIIRVQQEIEEWGGSGHTVRNTTFHYQRRINNDTTASNRAVLALPIAGLIFGAVHLLAWNFYFPNVRERFLWRLFSSLVAGVPIALASVERLGYSLDVESDKWSVWIGNLFWWLKSTLILVYAASRIYLIVMSFVSLRHLPESAYQTVEWVDYLPHL